jgi:hypothetical protein
MKNSLVVALFLGASQAVQRRHHHHHRAPHFDALTMYDSPFGMDAKHGWGGDEANKLENKIDLGIASSDEDVDNNEPSEDMIKFEREKLEMQNQIKQAQFERNIGMTSAKQPI